MKLFRMVTAALIMLAMAMCPAMAETEREYTADEQAYAAYLDINYAFGDTIAYMDEMLALWDTYMDVDDMDDLSAYWFENHFVARVKGDPIKGLPRFSSFRNMAKEKYGFEEVSGMYDMFMADMAAYGNTSGIVFVGLEWIIETGYIASPEEIKAQLDDAFEGIRALMALDPDHPCLEGLKEYYKEAVLAYEYITGDTFNYSELSALCSSSAQTQRSREMDFEFMFDPAGYEYVKDVRLNDYRAEMQAIYDSAAALEASGNYAAAIDMYWECKYHEDSLERIEACREALANK